MLGISRQAVYQGIKRKEKRAKVLSQIKPLVLAIRREMPRIGTRKLYYLLKEDFDRFMTDDDISAYVANFKSILREIDSLKVNSKDSKDISEKDFSSIKDFGLSLVEHSNSDEICSLYKIDKSYVYSMIRVQKVDFETSNLKNVRFLTVL